MILDVTPLTLGTETVGGVFHGLIQSDKKLKTEIASFDAYCFRNLFNIHVDTAWVHDGIHESVFGLSVSHPYIHAPVLDYVSILITIYRVLFNILISYRVLLINRFASIRIIIYRY